jgi:hypothetical protein
VIKFNEIFLADLKDDFELAGKGEQEFSIYDFIGHDLSRAFGVGYGIKDWKLWVPVTVRKELRHVLDNLEQYNPQLKWINSKVSKEISTEDYVNYIIDNIFCDNELDLINILITLGSKLKEING